MVAILLGYWIEWMVKLWTGTALRCSRQVQLATWQGKSTSLLIYNICFVSSGKTLVMGLLLVLITGWIYICVVNKNMIWHLLPTKWKSVHVFIAVNFCETQHHLGLKPFCLSFVNVLGVGAGCGCCWGVFLRFVSWRALQFDDGDGVVRKGWLMRMDNQSTQTWCCCWSIS